MVRGRRTRKTPSGGTATANANSSSPGPLSPLGGRGVSVGKSTIHNPLAQQNGVGGSCGGAIKMVSKGNVVLVEDYCCASPKRKEYKIDELLLKSGTAATSNGFTGLVSNGRTLDYLPASQSESNEAIQKRVLRGNQNPMAAQNGVTMPMNGAVTNTATTTTTNGRLCQVAGNEITRFLLSQSKSKSRKTRKKSPNIELVNDDTCDSFTHATTLNQAGGGVAKMEADAESERDESEEKSNGLTAPIRIFGRLPTNNNEENIFLQEPVLKLTVDKAACVLVQPRQQSEQGKQAAATVALINQDSNSGDSGVVVDKMQEAAAAGGVAVTPKAAQPQPLLSVAARQRKPTTPHRILCPSSPQNGNAVKEEMTMDQDTDNGGGTPGEEEHIANVQITKRQLNLPTKAEEEEQGTMEDVKPVVPHDSVQEEKKQSVAKAAPKNGIKASSVTNGNQSTIDDFFKVRRSVRKTKKEVEREEQLAIEKAILAACDFDLAVKMFENKGRGIVGTRPFARGEFVVEYVGEFISIAEANRREKEYARDQNTGCYMYYFKHKNKQYCIDATEETGKLGRLVNHSRNGNLMTRTVEVRGQPHLVLIAKEDIEEGKELTYDYGDRSKESLLHHPWLAY